MLSVVLFDLYFYRFILRREYVSYVQFKTLNCTYDMSLGSNDGHK